jgi:hypothetical protein
MITNRPEFPEFTGQSFRNLQATHELGSRPRFRGGLATAGELVDLLRAAVAADRRRHPGSRGYSASWARRASRDLRPSANARVNIMPATAFLQLVNVGALEPSDVARRPLRDTDPLPALRRGVPQNAAQPAVVVAARGERVGPEGST